MRKFLAVVKHEYKKIVLKWTFLIGILLFPVIAAMFAIVPALIFSIKGEPTRIAVVDTTGKIAPRLKENLSAEKLESRAAQAAKDSNTELNAPQEEKMKQGSEQFENSFVFEDYNAGNKTVDEIRVDLIDRIVNGQLDAYLLIPPDFESKEAVLSSNREKPGILSPTTA